jgi:REP-associated tyrosine transposase
MKYDPQKHHRRSIRLKEYDYTQSGWYFITIVVQNREPLLGNIVDGSMVLNEAGQIVKNFWIRIPSLRKSIELDEFVIMRNHFHGILLINENPKVRATDSVAPTLKANSLGSILGQYKSATTKEIQKFHIHHFKWQRNYWERVIRDEDELNRIRKYIIENPMNWNTDEESQ